MQVSTAMIGATLALLLALPAGAQPTVERSTMALASPALPVLDDYGELIPEAAIAQVARRRGTVRKFLYPALGAIVGVSIMAEAPGLYLDCSIYEPCSDKDKFYQAVAIPFGFAAGAMIGWSLPAGEVTRLEAVKRIRAARREAREGRNP